MGTVQKCFKLDITDVSLLLTERSIYTTNKFKSAFYSLIPLTIRRR